MYVPIGYLFYVQCHNCVRFSDEKNKFGGFRKICWAVLNRRIWLNLYMPKCIKSKCSRNFESIIILTYSRHCLYIETSSFLSKESILLILHFNEVLKKCANKYDIHYKVRINKRCLKPLLLNRKFTAGITNL
jgi:hypothetical protein